MRVRQRSRHRPADHHERVARPARPEGDGHARGRHVRDLRRHPRDGRQSHRCDGGRRLPRLGLAIEGRASDRERARLPGAPRQPLGDDPLPALPGGRRQPRDPARRGAASHLALRRDRPRGMRSSGLLRAGRLRGRVRIPQVPREARVLGTGRQVQRPEARLDQRHRRLPERRGHLHRLHDARFPRQVHAVHGRAARAAPSRRWPAAPTATSSGSCGASPRRPSTRNRSGGFPDRRSRPATDRPGRQCRDARRGGHR